MTVSTKKTRMKPQPSLLTSPPIIFVSVHRFRVRPFLIVDLRLPWCDLIGRGCCLRKSGLGQGLLIVFSIFNLQSSIINVDPEPLNREPANGYPYLNENFNTWRLQKGLEPQSSRLKEGTLFHNNDLVAFDLCPINVLLVFLPIFCVSLLYMSHFYLVFTFRAKVPVRGGYYHVAPTCITRHFHLLPPEGSPKNNFPFSHLSFRPSLPDPHSQNPRNSTLFLWFCSIGSNKSNPNLSANSAKLHFVSAKLFLGEP